VERRQRGVRIPAALSAARCKRSASYQSSYLQVVMDVEDRRYVRFRTERACA
jgi:hypothetical protein